MMNWLKEKYISLNLNLWEADMLTGELLKDIVLVQCRPKEIIEYIRKLEAQIVNNHQKLSGEIDRLERLLDRHPVQENPLNPFKKQGEKIDNDWRLGTGNVLWDYSSTSGTSWTIETFLGTSDD